MENLFNYIFKYCPKGTLLPVENFCTQLLSWCLQNSTDFQQRFIELLGPDISKGAQIWNVRTQETFKSETLNEDGQCDKGQLDLVISSRQPSSNAVLVFIESKIECDLTEEQIEKYSKELKKNENEFPKGFLVTLTKYSVLDSALIHRKLRWHEVVNLLRKSDIENVSLSTFYTQFADFLKQRGLEKMKIPRIDHENIDSYVNGIRLREALQALLQTLRDKEKGFAQTFAKELWCEETEGQFRLGLIQKPQTNYFFLGVQLKPKPTLNAEANFSPKIDHSRRIDIEGDLKRKFGNDAIELWPDGSGISLNQSLDEGFNGDTKKIEEWLQRAGHAFINFDQG